MQYAFVAHRSTRGAYNNTISPGGNFFPKHKTIKFDVMGEWLPTKYISFKDTLRAEVTFSLG